jgi:hypothetical protein
MDLAPAHCSVSFAVAKVRTVLRLAFKDITVDQVNRLRLCGFGIIDNPEE